MRRRVAEGVSVVALATLWLLALTLPATAGTCSSLGDCFDTLAAAVAGIAFVAVVVAGVLALPHLLRGAGIGGRDTVIGGAVALPSTVGIAAGGAATEEGRERRSGGEPHLVGRGLRGTRSMGSGRLRGYQRGSTELGGGDRRARDTFRRLTGRQPHGQLDRAVVGDHEILYRASSRSTPPTLEVVDHLTRFLEKVTFLR